MTTLADKIEALAKDATPGPWDFSAKDGWIFSHPDPLTTYVITEMQSSNDTNAALIVELVNNLPTILRALRDRDQAVEALREIEG